VFPALVRCKEWTGDSLEGCCRAFISALGHGSRIVTVTPSPETRPSGATDWPYGGARWWRFDFHTHTPASQDYGKGPDQALERGVEPRDWLLGFMRAGIDCVAVTDHNSGEWIDRLKAALAELAAEPCRGFRPLWLFPSSP